MKASLDGGGFNLPPTEKAHSQKAPTAEAEEEGAHTPEELLAASTKTTPPASDRLRVCIQPRWMQTTPGN